MKKNDGLVMVVILVLLAAFVFVLPRMNDLVTSQRRLNEQLEEKLPHTYHCLRNKVEDTYTLNQDATYTMDQKGKITQAVIKQDYVFEEEEAYRTFLENQEEKKVTGMTKTITPHFDTFTVHIDTAMDLTLASEDEIDSNFPKTYPNLLIYTKGQECNVTYYEK